jgi:hypothetical protein
VRPSPNRMYRPQAYQSSFFSSTFVALNRSLTHSSQEMGSYLAGCSSSMQLGRTPQVSLKLNPVRLSV